MPSQGEKVSEWLVEDTSLVGEPITTIYLPSQTVDTPSVLARRVAIPWGYFEKTVTEVGAPEYIITFCVTPIFTSHPLRPM